MRDALVSLCGDIDTAAKTLKLGVKNRSEIDHNLRLESSGVMPAIDRYTGVLYDALNPQDLPEHARRWLGDHVSIQSALFGLVSADDLIPAYRLSASSRLPDLDESLKQEWKRAHLDVDFAGLGWVLDLRSKDYVALAPVPQGSGRWLQVSQRGEDGEFRALNHFNKAAKGDLVRRLALSAAQIDGPDDFIHWANNEGLDVHGDARSPELTLVTQLGALPVAATR